MYSMWADMPEEKKITKLRNYSWTQKSPPKNGIEIQLLLPLLLLI